MDKKKCFFEEHKEVLAIFYCQNCNLFMCNKCEENFHSKYFKNHRSYKIDKDNQDIFTGYCQENNHLEALKFFCKNHNKLCCSSCICKIKNEIYGQHTDCDVCYINDIKEEKKAKLRENIKQLQDLSNNMNESINKIKKLYEIINKKKEDLKIKVQGIFTKIRNILNKREDEILIEIDKKYDNKYFKDDLIKEIEKLPNKIKMSLEKGKAMGEEWENDNKLNAIINDSINIENNINNITLINDSIKKCFNINNSDINFFPDEEKEINSILEKIKKFGKLYANEDIFNESKIIDNNIEYVLSLNNWINPNKEKIRAELLYRLSENGIEFSNFHKLCDNKEPTLTLFHVSDGNKVGIYTPLSWNTFSGWKNDMETF